VAIEVGLERLAVAAADVQDRAPGGGAGKLSATF
jgi:hypothetical protein